MGGNAEILQWICPGEMLCVKCPSALATVARESFSKKKGWHGSFFSGLIFYMVLFDINVTKYGVILQGLFWFILLQKNNFSLRKSATPMAVRYLLLFGKTNNRN